MVAVHSITEIGVYGYKDYDSDPAGKRPDRAAQCSPAPRQGLFPVHFPDDGGAGAYENHRPGRECTRDY